MKTHYSCAELAAMKLPGLPTSERNMRERAQREGWASRQVSCQGGKGGLRTEYQPPKAIQEAILARHLDAALASQPAAVVTAPPSSNLPIKRHASAFRSDGAMIKRGLIRRVKADAALTDIDRARRDAALVLCRAVESVLMITGCSAKHAMRELADRIISGVALPELQEAAAVTYVKPRKTGQTVEALLSRLQKMYAAYQQGRDEGDAALYLVPGKAEKHGQDPIHIRAFLIHYCRPSRPPVIEAWRDAEAWFVAHGFPRPAADTFYRIEKSLPVTIKYRGRMTGGQWRSLLPYVARDVSMFKANDIWVGDGHSFKAKVQHPIHGQAFTPEVTLIIDWVSRKIVGWSVDLAESTIAVSAAFRHAQVQTRARPLVYYSDNGGGQTGKLIDCAIHGTLARQGIAHETGIPGNAQGRGIIERLWQVTLIPLARTYPTCTWKGADKETVRKSLVAINKKDGERLLPSFGQFLIDVDACINKYNSSHEHSELAGLVPETAYQAKLDPDSICFGPSDTDINTLWMPEVSRTAQRGVVSLFGNEYFNRELPGLLAESEKVRVRFDIHNADRVWLMRMDGSFLCVAEWDGHKRAAFPVPYIEQKRADRAAGKIKRGERIIDEAEAELGNTYEALPIIEAEQLPPMDITPAIEAMHADHFADAGNVIALPKAQAQRPMFDTDPKKYRWLLQNRDQMTQADQGWLAWYQSTSEWEDLFGDIEMAVQ
jgi:putative transposase